MVRRSHQSYGTAEEREEGGVEIYGIFQYVRPGGRSFCFHDGATHKNELGIEVSTNHWLPTSECYDTSWGHISELARGERIRFRIPEWLAVKEGLV